METQEKIRMKEHKRRMIANQRKKKQEGLDKILSRVKEEVTKSSVGDTAERTFASLYSPIPHLENYPLQGNISENQFNRTSSGLMFSLTFS